MNKSVSDEQIHCSITSWEVYHNVAVSLFCTELYHSVPRYATIWHMKRCVCVVLPGYTLHMLWHVEYIAILVDEGSKAKLLNTFQG